MHAESPEALIDKLEQICAEADYHSILECVLPSDRPLFTLSFLVAASDLARAVAGGEEDRVTRLGLALQEIVNRHRVPPATAKESEAIAAREYERLPEIAERMFQDFDCARLFGDLLAEFAEWSGTDDQLPLVPVLAGTDSAIVRDGDRAQVAAANGETIHFERFEGSWYLRAPGFPELAPESSQ